MRQYFENGTLSIFGIFRYEIRPKLLLMTNRKLHNAPSIDSKVDDLELIYVRIFSEFRVIS